MSDLISRFELARLWGISPRRIALMVRKGLLPHVVLPNGEVRSFRQEIERAIRRIESDAPSAGNASGRAER